MARWLDWLREADAELKIARYLRDGGHHGWACFTAHQSAEKGLKAMGVSAGLAVWGHDLVGLLLTVTEGAPPGVLRERCARLDKHYIPPRYPDAFPTGSPAEKYEQAEADQALDDAGKVVGWCHTRLSPPAPPAPGGAVTGNGDELPPAGQSGPGSHTARGLEAMLPGRPRLESLARFLDVLFQARGPDVVYVVLYGSMARGDFGTGSDYDVLVALRSDRGRSFLDRLGEMARLNPGGVQACAYTMEDLAAMEAGGHLTLLEAAADGVSLHDSEGVFAAMRERIDARRRSGSLVRIENGWRLHS